MLWLVTTLLFLQTEQPPLEPTKYTLDEIRSAVEKISGGWKTRRVEYLKHDLERADGLPTVKGSVVQTPDGKFELDGSQLAAGAEVRMTKGSRYSYPFLLDLTLGSRRLADCLQEPEARALGEANVDGSRCVRIEIAVPPGLSSFSDPPDNYVLPNGQRALLDLDLSVEFWPRKVQTFSVSSKSERPVAVITFSDFRRVDARWIPHQIDRIGQSVIKERDVITKVVFDGPLPPTWDKPLVAVGTVTRRSASSSRFRDWVSRYVPRRIRDFLASHSPTLVLTAGLLAIIVAIGLYVRRRLRAAPAESKR